MTLTTIATLGGLAGAALVAWRFGGPIGAGAIVGYVGGAAITGFGLARQRRVIRERPEHALRALVEAFLVKLAAIVVFVLLLVLVAPLRAALDARSFFLGFAGAVLIVLLPGTVENARILRERRAP